MWHNYTRRHTNALTRNKRAKYNKKEQTMFKEKEQAGKSDVQTVVNMSRADGELTLLTIQVFNGEELVNVITSTVTTAHFNGEGIKIIKDGQVETFGTKR